MIMLSVSFIVSKNEINVYITKISISVTPSTTMVNEYSLKGQHSMLNISFFLPPFAEGRRSP